MNQELLEKCKNADLLKEVAKGKEISSLRKVQNAPVLPLHHQYPPL